MIPFDAATIRRYEALGAWGRETLDDIFLRNFAVTPDRLALIDDPNKAAAGCGEPLRLTYRELGQRVDDLAARLAGAGIGRDDILLVQLPNVAELILAYLAAARLGAIVSPMPVQYRAKEIADILGIVRPRAALTVARFHGYEHAAALAAHPALSGVPILAWGRDLPPGVRAVATLPAERVAASGATANDIFTICWTSGTESTPKAVPRTHNNWLATGMTVAEGAEMQPGDGLLNPFPAVNVASIGGLIVPWLLTGGTLALHLPFDLATFLRQIAEEGLHYTIAAPAILNRLAAEPEKLAPLKRARFRAFGTGSAPPDPWMMRALERDHGLPVTNFFGSNEGMSLCAGPAHILDPELRARYFPRTGRDDLNWAGRSTKWPRTKLVDPDRGAEVTEPGRAGEMWVQGPQVFPGYYRQGAIDRGALDAEGFFRSGDLFEIAVALGEPRYYRFVGRRKEIVNRGGMKIAPAELDALLAEHPAVDEAAAAPLPHAVLGEIVGAFVVAKPGATVTLADLAGFLEARGLAKYKLPERLFLLEKLPRNPLGKVLRASLTALATHAAAMPPP